MWQSRLGVRHGYAQLLGEADLWGRLGLARDLRPWVSRWGSLLLRREVREAASATQQD